MIGASSIIGNRNVAEARKAWRAKARSDLRKPWFWILVLSLYIATFAISATLIFALEWTAPHLPWIPKPYVNPDYPPVVTAFCCANMIPLSLIVVLPLLYVWGGPPIKISAEENL